ncbi:helix-turn-helix domain-containing protein [Paenibacillus sp. LMG 31461]|uniref:Helix-turn-helix domain-containing protein n=1 Tax=Paenibacillus plantarum TaxID=2654975 RepID=A0ABX1XII7_9BACL|nr:helix-turn-helix transcriptional regulator [Paenibacillus plantarum]NOU68347.1 helix-turn-helix domain-containing protein [Paenibacillus plantarum]
MSVLGSRIKYLREKLDISQKRLADALGITNIQVSRYETGDRKPDPDTIKKIAEFFDVSSDFLLGVTSDQVDSNETNSSIGRAFFGGADQYTEDELEIARAAAQAAVEAYRKGLNKKK